MFLVAAGGETKAAAGWVMGQVLGGRRCCLHVHLSWRIWRATIAAPLGHGAGVVLGAYCYSSWYWHGWHVQVGCAVII